MTTAEVLRSLICSPEGSRIEFKAATGSFHFDELTKYCVALANEGGGHVILGVTDKRPRRIVGTRAFAETGRTEAGLYEKLRQRIRIEEVQHEDKRVLIVHVPARMPGTAWQCDGAYWMRAGDALLPMSDQQLRHIHEETGPDFSAELCASATIEDLDREAIGTLRRLWDRKSPGKGIATRPVDRLLADAELLVDGKLNYAALILLGTHAALGRYLAQAEIVLEYRSSDVPGPAADRHDLRRGFLQLLDEIWRIINLRNDRQHFQQGLFVWDVLTFDERTIREAVLNAVSHRNYRDGGSVFVRQYPRRVEVVSPGGLPPGITTENILWQHKARNRRIAEVLSRCGLVERAGQGFDLIYRECIRQSKPLPDFTRTDEHSVWVTLNGSIQDPEFLRFLEEVGRERTELFTTDDFLVVDLVHRGKSIPEHLESRVDALLEGGVIERIGRGRGVRLLLSGRFYRQMGQSGVYTRKRGLDRETNKALLLKHIEANQGIGSRMEELRQVLPALGRSQIQVLLREMVKAASVHVHGATRAARWYPGPSVPDCNHGPGQLQ